MKIAAWGIGSFIVALIIVIFIVQRAYFIADQGWEEAKTNLALYMAEQRKNIKAEYDKNFQEGKTLQSEKKFPEAIPSFRKAIEVANFYNSDTNNKSEPIDTNLAHRKIVECLDQSNVAIKFYALISQGDSLSDLNPYYYIQAKSKYAEAKSMGYDDGLVNQKSNLLKLKINNQVKINIENARLFLSKGYKQQALKWLNDAKELNPTYPELDSLIALCN